MMFTAMWARWNLYSSTNTASWLPAAFWFPTFLKMPASSLRSASSDMPTAMTAPPPPPPAAGPLPGLRTAWTKSLTAALLLP